MYEYLDSYTKKFELDKLIQFNSTVIKAEPNKGGWAIVVQQKGKSTTDVHQFDVLVVANGIFSDPYIPKLEGREDFESNGG